MQNINTSVERTIESYFKKESYTSFSSHQKKFCSVSEYNDHIERHVLNIIFKNCYTGLFFCIVPIVGMYAIIKIQTRQCRVQIRYNGEGCFFTQNTVLNTNRDYAMRLILHQYRTERTQCHSKHILNRAPKVLVRLKMPLKLLSPNCPLKPRHGVLTTRTLHSPVVSTRFRSFVARHTRPSAIGGRYRFPKHANSA